MYVNGTTELVGIIGYPIDYTLSPTIHNAAFRAMQMNWLYIPLRVPPGRAREALGGLRALGFKGANVTIPHKVESANYVDEMEGDAALLGAINTISLRDGLLVGHNTDTEGFAEFLSEMGIKVRGASTLLIGAGGASRAVGLVMAREGASRIFVMNRTPEKTRELMELLKRRNFASEIFERTFDFHGADVIRECEVIVNCTPLANQSKEELPLDYDCFGEGQWVLDLNYSKSISAFLEEASRRGARTANGEGMLLNQAAASFRIWTGRNPPKQEMKKALSDIP
jgi:shikimate dehydrogenase